MKRKLFSILALLLMAMTGARASPMQTASNREAMNALNKNPTL